MQKPLRSHGEQLLRFCAVGALCYVCGMAVMLSVCELGGFHYIVGYLSAFLVTNAMGFLLNGRFTFAANNQAQASIVRYMLVNITLLMLNTLALIVLVEIFHMWYVAATVLLAGINIPISFMAHRTVSYRLRHLRAAEAAPTGD